MKNPITAATLVAGVVGAPIRHSLSPLIHNAWLDALGVNGVYVAFAPPVDGFSRFVDGLRGGAIVGLNVTAPFKAQALAAADALSATARGAGSANLVLFKADGRIFADSTDGVGLLGAIAEQAPAFDVRSGPAAILGAGGAAAAAAAALIAGGAPEVRLINRSQARAELAVEKLGPLARAVRHGSGGLADAHLLVNALPAGVEVDEDLDRLAPDAVVLDMTYRPLSTPLLGAARVRGLRCVDGLAMLIAQGRPSFEALFGVAPPTELDVRALAQAAC